MYKVFLFPALTVFLVLAFGSPARAEEELAPGYNVCVDKALSTADNQECLNRAYTYWDNVLNANFKKARASAQQEDPEAARRLVNAQKAWVQYKEAMSSVLVDMGGGGSLSYLEANIFLVQETRKQARLLAVEQ